MRFKGSVALFAFASAGCVALAAPSPGLPAPASHASATANPLNWPKAASPAAITGAKTEDAITALISEMTLEQKVGQLIQADISSVTPADLRQYPLKHYYLRRNGKREDDPP